MRDSVSYIGGKITQSLLDLSFSAGEYFFVQAFYMILVSDLKLIKLSQGLRVIGISGSLIWSKTLMELIYNPFGEFRWSPDGPFSQIHSPNLHAEVPGIFSDLLRSVQMLKREWGAENNGKLPHLFIPSKTATMVPELTVEDLPLSRTADLVPEFAVKVLPLGITHRWQRKYNKLNVYLSKFYSNRFTRRMT